MVCPVEEVLLFCDVIQEHVEAINGDVAMDEDDLNDPNDLNEAPSITARRF